MTIEQEEHEFQQEEVELLEGGEIIEDEEMEMMLDDDNEDQMDDGDQAQEQLFRDDSVQGFFGHAENSVYSISVHPVMKDLICSGGGDDLAHLWLRSDGSHLFSLSPVAAISHSVSHSESVSSCEKKFSDSVVDVRFSSDGSLLACGCMDGSIALYSISISPAISVQLVGVVDGPDEVVVMRWHPHGHVLLAGSQDGNIWMYSVSSSQVKLMSVFAYHTEQISSIEWLSDGKSFLTCSTDGSLCLWNPRHSESPQWRLSGSTNPQFHQSPIISMCVSHTGLIATGDDSGTIRLTHASTGKIIGHLTGGHAEDASVESLLFLSPTAGGDEVPSVLCSAGMDGAVVVWDLKSMGIRSTLSPSGSGAGVNHVLPLPGNPDLIVTSTVDEYEPVITVWNWKSGERMMEWRGHQAPILTVQSCGEYIVSGGDDGVCLIFD